MTKVTLDYMVPLSVEVDVESGEVGEIWLHLESFQSSTPGWFVGEDKADIRFALRQAFISGLDDHAEGEFADGESDLGDRALAIADRVALRDPEIRIHHFTVDPPYPDQFGTDRVNESVV